MSDAFRTYFQKSDHWEDDPRLEGLPWSTHATLDSLYAYCSRALVDVVPPGVPFTRFTRYAHVRTSMRDRELLLAAGLIEETLDGGLRLPDFTEQLEKRLAKREDDAERKRRERARRAHDGSTPGAHRDRPGSTSGAHRDSESRSQTQNASDVTRDLSRAGAEEVEKKKEKKTGRPTTSRDPSRPRARGRRGELEPLAGGDFGLEALARRFADAGRPTDIESREEPKNPGEASA